MATDPIAPLDVYATNAADCDPAIDDADAADGPSAEDRLDAYRKTRDPAALVLRAGASPTRFVVRGMSAMFVQSVLASLPAQPRNALAFACACHEVVLPDGAVLKPRSLKAAAHGARCSEDEWLDVIAQRFGVATVDEIGRVAYERARLPRDARGPFSFWVI